MASNSQIIKFSDFFSHNVGIEYFKIIPSPYYKQIIEIWQELKTNEMTSNEILNEKLQLNKLFLIDNKPVCFATLQNSPQKTLKNILNKDFSFKSRIYLTNENIQLSILEYNSLVTAIPTKWMKQLKQTPALPFEASVANW